LTSTPIFACLNLYFVRIEMERKTLDFFCQSPGCNFVDYYDYYMTHSLDGYNHAWVYLSTLTGWLHPYLGSRLLCTLLWMVAPIPHTSCSWDISCTSPRRFSGGGVFGWTCSCKAFHPSISLGPHALGGICYTTICHYPYYPYPASWRTHPGTYEKWHDLQTPAWHSSEHDLYFPWRHLLLKNPKNSPFSIGAVP